ncbi:MAG: ComEC/Rec2 family competence protein [candidate division FCPU426 bacterium]
MHPHDLSLPMARPAVALVHPGGTETPGGPASGSGLLFYQRPLLQMGAAAWAGVLLARAWPAAWVLGIWGAALLLAVWAWRCCRQAWAGPVVVLATGLWFHGLAAMHLQAANRDVSHLGSRREIVLEGRLESLPEQVLWGQAWRSRLRCETAEWKARRYEVSGGVYLQVPGPIPSWLPGDRLTVRGSLEAIAKPFNPGEYDFSTHAAHRGVRGRLQVQLPKDAKRTRAASAWDWRAGIGRLRRWCLRQLDQQVKPPGCRWVRGIVIGDRSGLSPADQELLAAAGLAHILAVSGMNVGLVFGLIFGLAACLRLPRPAGTIAAVAASWAYTLLTGAEPPVARAAWMLSAVALSHAFGRQPDPLSGLSLAALLLLAKSPLSGTEAGFQLSFAATAALVLVWPKAQWIGRHWPRPLAWPAISLLTTGACLLATAPLTLYHFYNLTPVALLANLPAVPLASVILTAGLAAIGLAAWWPTVASIAGWTAGLAAAGLEHVAALSALLPGHRWFVFPPSGWWVAGCYVLTGLALVAGKKQRTSWMPLLAWCLWYPVFGPEPLEPDETRVTFFSLAVGEATLLRSGDGTVCLLDTGPEQEFYYRVRPCLAALGLNRLDALLISHSDSDHAGGVSACLRSFSVRRLAAADRSLGLPVGSPSPEEWRRGRREKLGTRLRLRALWPPAGSHQTGNETSLVLGCEVPGGSLLFTGDSRADCERQWQLPRTYALLKVGHHGDRKATSPGLLLQCRPEIAVIMPGTRNPFGFPDPELLGRLGQAGLLILDARQLGAVELRLRPNRPLQWLAWRRMRE